MKKLFSTLSYFLIIACIVFISYSTTYRITDNKKQLENNILQFINRPTVIYNNIDIKQELNLDNKKYILFVINNTLGGAELTKGLNNKYKIEFIRHGSSYFRHEINKTNKGKYLIIKGKNYDLKIAYAKALLDNKEYKISIPQQEYFMVYCPVPIETQRVNLAYNYIKLFNKNDVDITDEMFKVLFQ